MNRPIEFPKIDERDSQGLLDQFKSLVPFYTPEWRIEGEESSAGAGLALVKIFIYLMGTLTRQINRLPEKHVIAFLDRIGVKQVPALPASVPMSFSVSGNASRRVTIPAKTQVAAGDVIFETEQTILAVPAMLLALYAADTTQDAIYEYLGHIQQDEAAAQPLLKSSAALFSGENLQQHILYLGHPDLFNISGQAKITLSAAQPLLKNSAAQPLPEEIAVGEWYYWGDDDEGVEDWHRLTVEAPNDNDLLLSKMTTGEIKAIAIDGIESRWLRCCVAPSAVPAETLYIDTIDAVIEPYSNGNSPPDLLFYNHVPIEPVGAFFPFGKIPRLYDTFYIACSDVFARKGSDITVTFTFNGNAVSNEAVLLWEYWNGSAWHSIKDLTTDPINAPNLLVFAADGSIAFSCPHDFSATKVHGQENLWVRVRLIAGDYGQVVYADADGDGVWGPDSSGVKPPEINTLSLSYSTSPQPVQQAVTFNNLQYSHHHADLAAPGSLFAPFPVLAEEPWTIYLAVDNKLEKGPISLFFAVAEQPVSPQDIPILKWEYSDNALQWQRLEAVDSTMGLTRSGVVELNFPRDFSPTTKFGTSAYWFRVRLIYQDFDAPLPGAGIGKPIITGLFLNTTWAIQAETVSDEIIGSGDSTAGQTFTLKRRPVISEKIWIDEIKTISNEEMLQLKEEARYETREEMDKDDNITAFWIRWQGRESLRLSAADDRHYELEPVPGQIRFGNGANGRPVPTGSNNIIANYRGGGGKQGNLPAFEITAIKTAVAGLDKAWNPLASEKGSDRETIAQLLKRGPQIIKHRDRAQTVEDFEQIVRRSSGSIARVKCLANFNDLGQYKTGWVTVVVIPRSVEPRPSLSLNMKHYIRDYLLQRVSCTLAAADQIQVWGPLYLEISVTTKLVAGSAADLPIVEQQAMAALEEFLAPLSGGDTGQGWEFGTMPCFSDFFALLEQINGVDYTLDVSLSLKTLESGTDNDDTSVPQVFNSPESLDHFAMLPYAVVCSGKHEVMVNVNG
jgi:Baseplate J-like protein